MTITEHRNPGRVIVIDWHTHFVAPHLEPVRSAQGTWPGIARDDGLHLTLAGTRYRRIDERTFDADSRVLEFDKLGIDAQVLSPPPFVLAFRGPQTERVSLTRQQNDGMLDAARRYPKRFTVLAMLPVSSDAQAVPDTLAELERLGTDPAIVGVCLVPSLHDFVVAGDGHEHWRMLWATLEARRWVVFVHPDASAVAKEDDGIATPFGFGLPAATGRFGARFVAQPWAAELNGMRVLLAHAGGVFPSIVDRLHKAWSMAGERGESPRAVARRLIFLDSVAYGRAPCIGAIEALGPDHMVYGSDYPFAAGVTLADLAQLGDDLVELVAGGSAALAGVLSSTRTG